MRKTNLFQSYLLENKIAEELFPIEMYFIKDRVESINQTENHLNNNISNKKLNIKPNSLTKISYNGNIHSLPVGNLSLIINNEKLI